MSDSRWPPLIPPRVPREMPASEWQAAVLADAQLHDDELAATIVARAAYLASQVERFLDGPGPAARHQLAYALARYQRAVAIAQLRGQGESVGQTVVGTWGPPESP